MVPVRGIGTADVGSMRVDGCCGYKVGLCNNYVPLRNVLPVNVNDFMIIRNSTSQESGVCLCP